MYVHGSTTYPSVLLLILLEFHNSITEASIGTATETTIAIGATVNVENNHSPSGNARVRSSCRQHLVNEGCLKQLSWRFGVYGFGVYANGTLGLGLVFSLDI